MPPFLFRSRPCYEAACHGLSVSYPTHNKGKMRGPGRFRRGKITTFPGTRKTSSSFFLKKRKRKFKADINGPTHIASAPPPCRPWPAHPARTSVGVPALGNYFFEYCRRLRKTCHPYDGKVDKGMGSMFSEAVPFHPYLTSSTTPAAHSTVHSGTRTMKRVCLVLCRKSIMPSQQPTPPPRRATHSSVRSGMRRLPLRFDFALSMP